MYYLAAVILFNAAFGADICTTSNPANFSTVTLSAFQSANSLSVCQMVVGIGGIALTLQSGTFAR
jgi:hypothetical protein